MGTDLDLYEFVETLCSARDVPEEALYNSDATVVCIEVGDKLLPNEVNERLIELGHKDGEYVTVLIQ